MKKAQVTIFIIIALILVAGGITFFLIQQTALKGSDTGTYMSEEASFSARAEALSTMVQTCLENQVRDAIDIKGIGEGSAGMIQAFVNTRLDDCIDYSYLTERGIEVEHGGFETEVIVNEDAILVDLIYPMTLSRGKESRDIETFSYSIKRLKTERLPIDDAGATIREVRLVTEDQDVELIIPAGTVVRLADGSVASEISMDILQRDFLGLSNSVVLGQVVYDGTPDGATFSQPITIKISYKEEDIPAGESEENIVVGRFQNGLWVGIPSNVDTGNNVVSASIYHFSTYATLVPSCNPIITNTITYDYGKVFEQTCGNSYNDAGSCIDATWVKTGGGFHEEETLIRPKILTVNAPLPTMSMYSKCVIKDWDKDDQIEEAVCKEPRTICKIYNIEISAIRDDIKDWANQYAIPEVITSDGIKDGSCTCQWYPAGGSSEAIDVLIEEHTDCQCELATYATYGYDDFSGGGGLGISQLSFFIPDGGSSCIMGNGTTGYKLELNFRCSAGDNCGNVNDQMTGDGNSYGPVSYPISPGVSLQTGENLLSFPIVNTNGDGCMWADAKLSFSGKGIYKRPLYYGCNKPYTQDECIQFGKEHYKADFGYDVEVISCEDEGSNWDCYFT